MRSLSGLVFFVSLKKPRDVTSHPIFSRQFIYYKSLTWRIRGVCGSIPLLFTTCKVTNWREMEGKRWGNKICRSIFFASPTYGCWTKNSGTPKWMVKIMEHPIKMGWFGGTPIFGNTHKFLRFFFQNSPGTDFYSISKNMTEVYDHCNMIAKLIKTTLKLTANTPENRPGPKRKQSYSNHPFSDAMLASGRVAGRGYTLTRMILRRIILRLKKCCPHTTILRHFNLQTMATVKWEIFSNRAANLK